MVDNGSSLSTIVGAALGSVAVFLLALYKDSRTHKRIDATDQWIGKVEKQNLEGIQRVEKAQKDHTEMILKHYPTIIGMNEALKPISEKIDRLAQGMEKVEKILDDEKNKKIAGLERENRILTSKLNEAEK